MNTIVQQLEDAAQKIHNTTRQPGYCGIDANIDKDGKARTIFSASCGPLIDPQHVTVVKDTLDEAVAECLRRAETIYSPDACRQRLEEVVKPYGFTLTKIPSSV